MSSDETTMSVPQISQTTKQTHGPHPSLIVRLQKRLDDLASQQEKLVENREQLLVDREAASMAQKKIREQRARSADTEIAFLNILRKHFNELGRPLPEDLLLAYDEVEKHHLQLRLLEEDNLQAVEDLGSAEWNFIELETEFYQYQLEQLLSEELEKDIEEDAPTDLTTTRTLIEPIPATPGVQYQAIIAEHSRLMKRFDNLRKQQMLRMDTFTEPEHSWMRAAEDTNMDKESTKLASDLLDLIAQCEIKFPWLRADLNVGAKPTFKNKRPLSEPDLIRNSMYERIETISHANSEGATSSHDDYIHVNEYISEWSLQSLKSSALEKLQYLNFLRPRITRKDALEQGFEHWESLITQSWADEHLDSLGLPKQEHISRPRKGTTAAGREKKRDDSNIFPEVCIDSSLASHELSSGSQDATKSLCSDPANETGACTKIAFDQKPEGLLQQNDQHDSNFTRRPTMALQIWSRTEQQATMIKDSHILTSDTLTTVDSPRIGSIANTYSCYSTLERKGRDVNDSPSLMIPLGTLLDSASRYSACPRVMTLISQKCTTNKGHNPLPAYTSLTSSSQICSKNGTSGSVG
jgi:hypothetical protein